SSKTLEPMQEALGLHFARTNHPQREGAQRSALRRWASGVLVAAIAFGIAYAAFKSVLMVASLGLGGLKSIIIGAGATFLRVSAALILGTLWTVPAGVAIGTHPKLARIAQPLAQIAASVPATALFPLVLLALIQAGGGMGTGSILLLLLGTQWYILF